MDSDKDPIGRDSHLCGVIPPLLDKYVVDFAQSIHLVVDINKVGDHLRVQGKRDKAFSSRVHDVLFGQRARRQANVNARLHQIAKGTLDWLEDLTQELTATNRGLAQHGLALAEVNASVARLCSQLAGVAGEIGDVARRLEHLQEDIRREMGKLDARLRKVEAKGDASAHLHNVFSRWEDARRFDQLSVLGRCYAAFEDLRWGPFGGYVRVHAEHGSELLETVANRAMRCMANDLGLSSVAERVETTAWLKPDEWRDGLDALEYLAEHYGETIPPVVAISSGRLPVNEWSHDVPLITSAERLANALANEMFASQPKGRGSGGMEGLR